MKAKRNLHFLPFLSLLFLSACYTTNPEQADALRTSRGTLPQTATTLEKATPETLLIEISVLPNSIFLQSGQRGTVAFSLPQSAPADGLPLSITTDIPESIIMPEASIPAGTRSVNIPMEGGVPGEGFLFIEADGCQSITVPVRVSEAL